MVIPFTIEDTERANEKLGIGLMHYGTLKSDSVQLQSFRGHLRPFVFKMQLEKLIMRRFSNAEVNYNY